MLDGMFTGAACDQSLEQALVRLMFDDNGNLEKLGRLEPEDLTDPNLAAILGAAMQVHAEGRPVNLVTLKPRLEGIRIDDNETGVDLIKRLSVGDVKPYARDTANRLRELALKRRLSETLANLAAAAVEDARPFGAMAVDGISQLNGYLADINAEQRRAPHHYDSVSAFIEKLKSGKDPIEISTGLKELDNNTGGWHRSQFIILAGRPGMGKSSVALSSMFRTAEKGHGVLFFSMEMDEYAVAARTLADYAYTAPAIQYFDLLKGTANPNQIRRLEQAAERFKGLPIEIDYRNGLTVGDIMVRARQAAETFREKGSELALIVVDHLLKIRPSSRYAGNPVKELDEISEGMCVMAKTLNVAVFGLHQLNRKVEERDNPRPLMSDLRGTGTLEQDADVILFAYRPAYRCERQLEEPELLNNQDKRAAVEAAAEELKNDLEIQIAKQRNGPTPTLHFWVDMAANVVKDPDWQNRGGAYVR
jgi:replicative DNA helicase